MELIIFIVSLMIFLSIGVPVAITLVLCAVTLMFYTGIGDAVIISQNMVQGTNNFVLMAIPFFMLAGEIMAQGGLSKRIVDFSNLIIGRIKGGLGYATVIACVLFAGLSGAAVAAAAAMGAILIPLMVDNGYKQDRATALVCAGAVIGPIIPPSIPFILLGTSAGLSVTRLFMGGIVPGLIFGLVLMFVWFFIVKKDGYTDTKKYTRQEAIIIIKDSIPALFLPIILLAGIRFGIFTPTEGGAFAVVYALIICVFWYKELPAKKLVSVCINAARSTAIVMFIVAAATAVGWFITVAQIPNKIADLLSIFIDRPIILMILLNIFLFVMGMILDITPNILIFAPVLFPVIEKAGIDPIYFGIIMVLNLCIGLITPPVGVVLYVGCSTGKVSFSSLVSKISPFLIAELAVLILLICFPDIVTVPIDIIMGER